MVVGRFSGELNIQVHIYGVNICSIASSNIKDSIARACTQFGEESLSDILKLLKGIQRSSLCAHTHIDHPHDFIQFFRYQAIGFESNFLLRIHNQLYARSTF